MHASEYKSMAMLPYLFQQLIAPRAHLRRHRFPFEVQTKSSGTLLLAAESDPARLQWIDKLKKAQSDAWDNSAMNA